MEIWKDIKDFEGLYQISDLGNVKSFNYRGSKKEKIIRPKVSKVTGALEIGLRKDSKRYMCIVSRLVYENFNNVKLKKNDIIMYKDEDKNNCILDNLYVISRSERHKLMYKQGKRKDKLEFEYYGEILNLKEISKRTGIKPQRIRERIYELNWNIYEAAEIPVAKIKRKVSK